MSFVLFDFIRRKRFVSPRPKKIFKKWQYRKNDNSVDCLKYVSKQFFIYLSTVIWHMVSFLKIFTLTPIWMIKLLLKCTFHSRVSLKRSLKYTSSKRTVITMVWFHNFILLNFSYFNNSIFQSILNLI